MQDSIKLKIFDEDLIIYEKSLLSALLKDRTTGKNIIWATNDYIKLGEIYKAENEIDLSILNGNNEKFIRPRITKSYEKQNNRTRDKAEVFTPSWVCNQQNNLIDEQWFGRKDVFNTSSDKTWTPHKGKIVFSNIKNKTWKDYIDARRIEITCGEAPYLVSRYDTVSGKQIALKDRIGFLDRKMRIVSENTTTEDEWFKWTKRAFQSVYGYEFQGDNLLLARENLLHTFVDNVKDKFKRDPTLDELKKIALIISWNIWQMDGLTFRIPLSDLKEDCLQLDLFETVEKHNKKQEIKYCKIKNWRSNIILEYRTLLRERKNG